MTQPFSPKFVTETDEPAPWTDCTWASGLMLVNKASLGKYPSNRAEREALRRASGDLHGGSGLDELRDGIHARYHWTLDLDFPSWQELLARWKRGDGAVVQGLYNRLPLHYQRWDPHFAARPRPAHAMYVQGHDRGGNYRLGPNHLPQDVFLCDPLGRSPTGTPPAKRYRGEWISADAIRYFLRGLAPTDGDLLAATAQNGSHT